MGGQEMDNTGVEKNVFAILYSTIHNWSNTWLYGGYDILGQSNDFIHLCWWYLDRILSYNEIRLGWNSSGWNMLIFDFQTVSKLKRIFIFKNCILYSYKPFHSSKK